MGTYRQRVVPLQRLALHLQNYRYGNLLLRHQLGFLGFGHYLGRFQLGVFEYRQILILLARPKKFLCNLKTEFYYLIILLINKIYFKYQSTANF